MNFEQMRYYIDASVPASMVDSLRHRLRSMCTDFCNAEQSFKEIEICYRPNMEQISQFQGQHKCQSLTMHENRFYVRMPIEDEHYKDCPVHLMMTEGITYRRRRPVMAKTYAETFSDHNIGKYLECNGFLPAFKLAFHGFVYRTQGLTVRLSSLISAKCESEPKIEKFGEDWILEIFCISDCKDENVDQKLIDFTKRLPEGIVLVEES